LFFASLEVTMSLKPAAIPPVPPMTVQVAHAAFPQRQSIGDLFGKTRLLSITSALLVAPLLTLLLTFSMYAAPKAGDLNTIAQTGSITGRVTTSDGADLGSLEVLAFHNHNVSPAAETIPDASGHYTLSELLPGIYSIDFFPGDESRYLRETYNDRQGFDLFDPVVVTANATTSGIDAELQLGAIITGQVTVAGTGAPIADLDVRVFHAVEGGSSTSTQTDALGHYAIVGLATGNYDVCFGLNDLHQYIWECYDGARFGEERQPVSVVAGTVTPNINAALALGGMITGQITSELTGEPLANIFVRAKAVNSNASGEASSDAAGFYTITTLPTNDYHVSFNIFDHSPNYAGEVYDNQPTEDSATPVAVTEAMTTSAINAALPYIANFTGRVEKAGTHAPLGNAIVDVFDAAGDLQAAALTNSSGHYTVTGLMTGTYRVRFRDDDYRDQFYANRLIFEEADWITVTPRVVIPNIDASLVTRVGVDLALASATTRPGALLATRGEDFNPIYSVDGGQSWQTLITMPFEIRAYAPPIAIVPKDDPSQPLRFLLGNASATDDDVEGIYRSGDSGATWSRFIPIDDPRCSNNEFDVDAIFTSPADPMRVYALVHCTKTVYVVEPFYESIHTLYFSADGGVNWQAVTMLSEDDDLEIFSNRNFLLPSPVDSARVYAQYDDASVSASRIWQRSENNGQSWITEPYTFSVLALDWTNAAKLYGVEDSGGNPFSGDPNLFRYRSKRSTNGGSTWEDWPQQPCRTSFQQLLTLPTADTLLLLCDQGLYRSNNAGDSWELLTPETDGELSVHNGDRDLILWVRGAELWGSRDQGATWADLGGWQDAFLPTIHSP
jgi:hypothetical protein